MVVKCSDCGMEFPTREAMQTHRKEMHDALSNVELTCTLCGYETDDAVEMETHKQSHPDIKT